MRIVQYKGRSPISKAIQWQTRSVYSHSALMLPDDSIIEAWHVGGVRHEPHPLTGHEPGTRIEVYVVDTTPTQDYQIERFVKSQVGKGYDFRAIARFLTREKGDNPERWFCSELVFAGFQHVGINLLERIEAWKVSPALIALSPYLK